MYYTSNRKAWCSSDKLHKLPLLCGIVRTQHLKKELHSSTVMGVAVVWPATLH